MKQVQGLKLIGQSWVYSYRFSGRAKRMTIGKFPAVTAKDASKGASILAGQVCCGRCPSSERKAARRRDVTDSAPIKDHVERVAAQYLKHAKARTRASTFAETKRVFVREILPVWRGKRLSEIGKQDVRKLVDVVAKRAPVGANRLLASLKTFLAFAVEQDVILVSPAATIRPPAPESPRERTLDDSELGAVLEACAGLGAYGQGVKLLALTGQRRSEVLGLRGRKSTWARRFGRSRRRAQRIIASTRFRYRTRRSQSWKAWKG